MFDLCSELSKITVCPHRFCLEHENVVPLSAKQHRVSYAFEVGISDACEAGIQVLGRLL